MAEEHTNRCLLRTQQCANPHHPAPRTGFQRSTQPPPSEPGGGSMKGEPETETPRSSLTTEVRLLRKEVIQPHLPVRLPCYDFVPIASPTFDDSLPTRGWAAGFGCYQLS